MYGVRLKSEWLLLRLGLQEISIFQQVKTKDRLFSRNLVPAHEDADPGLRLRFGL
jgi:hypothetical protein